MNTFRKWNGKRIEDWGSVMSTDAKSFYRAFKNYLKREFPDAELIGFKPNHYDFSGFIHQGDNYIYISHALDRYKERVDFNDSGVSTGVLYRTADGPKDYRGGTNNFCSINKLADCVRSLFDRMERQRASETSVKESKTLNEKIYTYDEIQDMVRVCNKDSMLKKRLLADITTNGPLGKKDKADIEYVIDSGSAEEFDKFDSAVADKFITSYEKAIAVKDSVKVDKMVNSVLEGKNLWAVVTENMGSVSGCSFDFNLPDYDSRDLEDSISDVFVTLGFEPLGVDFRSVDYPDGKVFSQAGIDFRWTGDTYNALEIEKALDKLITSKGGELLGIDFYAV